MLKHFLQIKYVTLLDLFLLITGQINSKRYVEILTSITDILYNITNQLYNFYNNYHETY